MRPISLLSFLEGISDKDPQPRSIPGDIQHMGSLHHPQLIDYHEDNDLRINQKIIRCTRMFKANNSFSDSWLNSNIHQPRQSFLILEPFFIVVVSKGHFEQKLDPAYSYKLFLK